MLNSSTISEEWLNKALSVLLEGRCTDWRNLPGKTLIKLGTADGFKNVEKKAIEMMKEEGAS